MPKYRNGFERDVGKILGKTWQYEPMKLEYFIPKKYTPDFVKGDVMVECKGFFRVGDTQKYLAVRDAAEAEGYEFVMLLYDPDKPVRRRCKTTMAKWCDKHNIRWVTLDTVEDLK